MFKPFPVIQLPGTVNTTHHISLGHITTIFAVGKSTCLTIVDSGAVTTPAPIDQVVAQVRQMGGILIEVQDRSNQTRYLMANHIVRVEGDRKGMAVLYIAGSRSNSGSAVITQMPVQSVLQKIAAVQ